MTTTLEVAGELCLVRPDARNAEHLLGLLGDRAVAAGYAASTFPAAVIAREQQYPTGLPLPTPAAIPHTDPAHVLRPSLAVALLDPPLTFGEMGSAERTVECSLAVMLLVGSPEDQVDVLGRVIAALQRPEWPELLGAAADGDDLAQRFSGLLG
jgi:PTS system galactitol-specific IIA component